MGQVILVEEDLGMTNLLSDHLRKYAGLETIPRKNAIDTIELLKLLPKVSLIITRSQIGDENTASELLNFIKENELPTSLIITGAKAPKDSEIPAVEDEKNWEDILYYSFQTLNIPLERVKKISKDYTPFPIEYFWPLKNLPCNVYLKLKKGQEDFYFLKRYQKDHLISGHSISNYIKEGVTDLYVLTEDERSFSNFLSDSYILGLAQEGPNLEAALDLLNIADHFLRKQITSFGLVKNAIQLGYRIQQRVLRLLKEHPLFPDIYIYLKKADLSYTLQSQIILAGIIDKLTEENFLGMAKHKAPLIEACFLHNIALGNRDDMALISNMNELESSELNFDDQLKVMNHGAEGANMALMRQDLLFGADQIIREHHGAVNGMGFPIPPSPNIKKASHLFMVCDQFARALYLDEELDKFDDDYSKQITEKLKEMWRI